MHVRGLAKQQEPWLQNRNLGHKVATAHVLWHPKPLRESRDSDFSKDRKASQPLLPFLMASLQEHSCLGKDADMGVVRESVPAPCQLLGVQWSLTCRSLP